MLDITHLTFAHTVISLVALGLGWPAICSLFSAPRTNLWVNSFLALAFLTSATGFLFPISAITPAMITDFVALAVLFGMFLLRRHPRLYAAGMLTSVYLLAFVTVTQLFLKAPALQPLGGPFNPTPIFGGAQLAVMAVFVIIGYRAVRDQTRRAGAA